MKKEVSIINRDVMVFAFFLFLSFAFWYLKSLEKETEADIQYPVMYTNLPRERVLIDESPVRLDIFLKGSGYSILMLKISGKRDPVLIDISKVNYFRVPGSKTFNYFIVTSELTKSLTVQLRSGCEITSIKPDTLFFTVEKADAKYVPYIPDVKPFSERKSKL